MDNIEKKSRRPRIGESRNMSVASAEGNSDITTRQSGSDATEQGEQPERNYNSGYQQRSYRPGNNNGPRQYNNRQNSYNQGYGRQGGYNNNNRYGNQGGYGGNRYNNQYNNQGYNPRHNQYDSSEVADSQAAEASSRPEGFNAAEGENTQPTYQPRQQYQGYNRSGGYNNRQGGYNNNYRQGGYNNRQGGYNNNRYNQGGYNNRPRTESFNANAEGAEDENGQQHNNNYQPRQPRYNNNRQGGYNNNRQGGYNNNRQGGFNNRQGGYNNNRQQAGGYNSGNHNNNRRPGNQRNQFGMPQGGKSFTPRPRPVIYEETAPAPDEQIRLNKYMANAGLCSRREADEFIKQGLVKVNGEVVTELGTKITPQDTIEYDDKVVTLERKCYILLNKPKDCVTTSDDPNGRLTVMDIVKGACNERIYPVGRLDRNTTGVLLLTNDGDLASKLTHPKYVKKKIYHVWTDKDITEDDMQRIADGIELEDGPIHADAISYATETDRNQAGIEIHSGRNRIVRRIFESLGYHVTKLDRVYFAGLTKKNLPRGRWRYLTQEEVNYLKMGSFE